MDAALVDDKLTPAKVFFFPPRVVMFSKKLENNLGMERIDRISVAECIYKYLLYKHCIYI